ncbi:long-chain-fatty-acid--CoA ligase [Nocardia amamiensis]|uniref:long-chain-fatty-acid--CoA ligase n=1 Tax=Nocardia amamiensis TaxID=404578 RepID=UPI00082C70C8|nr:long-chain-fatty-acid--CoA ligase [Nocardia amamiensis]
MTSHPVAVSGPVTVGLASVIAEHKARRPDAVALICGEREITYSTLHRVACRAANAILAAGLEPSARIGYLGLDSARYYQLLVAAAHTGVVLVPINRRLTMNEIAYVLDDSDCSLLFADSAHETVARQAVRGSAADTRLLLLDGDGTPGSDFAAWCAPFSEHCPESVVPQHDPILQLYTSGTTGQPKGVVISQQTLFAVRDMRRAPDMPWLAVPQGERCLVAIPGFHMAGLTWVVQGLLDGITTVVLPEFTPGSAVRTIRERAVTALCAVPAMLALLIAEPDVTEGDFASLRQVAYAGSPIPDDVLTRCLARFGCDFLQFYGMTETGTPITFLSPQDHVPGSPRLRSAGRPHSLAEVMVVDRTGDPVPPREVGEIVVLGPAPMLGYWKRPDATAATLADGWVRTGDAGWLDEDGYLFISDRIKDVIIVAGENVYPAEVENAIAAHPAVREVAVVGVPDDRWGEAVRAFVVLTSGQSVTPFELTLHLRDRLASFKRPGHIEFVDALPRNAAGKVLRRTLRDPFWSGRERAVN